SPPDNLDAVPISPTSILVTWDEPSLKEDIAKITGYKIEYRTGTDDYKTVVADTKSILTYFAHEGLDSGTTYYYRVSSINSEGIAPSSTNSGVQPQHTTEPSGLIAHDISPNQIRLKWYPPTNTFGQPISGYEIKRVLSPGVYDPVGETDSKTTTFVVNNLQSDKTHSFVVAAKVGFGYTSESHSASATPHAGSTDKFSNSPAVNVISVPSAPLGLAASPISSSQINLSWNAPSSNGNSAITGYRIEAKQDSGSFVTLVEDTKSAARTYQHTNLSPDSKYTYKVYAINSAGIGSSSNEAYATATYNTFKIQPIGKFAIDEGKTLTFIVKVSGSTAGISYVLDGNVPEGAQINANTGMFSWTTNHSQGTKSYTFDIVATKDAISDRQPITITVNDVVNTIPNIPAEPQDEPDAEPATIAPFVDITRDPQYYVDRYNNEPTYKTWFDENYPQYESIYDAVGLVAPLKTIAPFVDATQDPRYYILRYEYEPTYKTWFDENYPQYESIYDAVGLVVEQEFDNEYGYCGEGTKSIDGVCTIVDVPQPKPWWQFW
ncbi:MAG: fibronectin type III domain-containing protein, partial [Nitrosarchaeum sp.]|nr:fibronectin type III domain-containing protein [Nitrosarchaeum sp.]